MPTGICPTLSSYRILEGLDLQMIYLADNSYPSLHTSLLPWDSRRGMPARWYAHIALKSIALLEAGTGAMIMGEQRLAGAVTGGKRVVHLPVT